MDEAKETINIDFIFRPIYQVPVLSPINPDTNEVMKTRINKDQLSKSGSNEF